MKLFIQKIDLIYMCVYVFSSDWISSVDLNTSHRQVALIPVGWIVSSKEWYTEVQTSSISDRDLIWKLGWCRKGISYCSRMDKGIPSSHMTSVLSRRWPREVRDTEGVPRGEASRHQSWTAVTKESKDCRQTTRSWKRQGGIVSCRLQRPHGPTRNLILDLVSRTVGEYIPVVWSHPACGALLGSRRTAVPGEGTWHNV